MELKRLLMQFINLNFIERKNNKRKDQGHTATPNATCQRCGSHPHMLEIHALSKMLYAVSAQKRTLC